MSGAPWAVLGPAVPSQTPEGIRRRYRRTVAWLSVLLGGLLLAAFLLGEPRPYFDGAMESLALWAGRRGAWGR